MINWFFNVKRLEGDFLEQTVTHISTPRREARGAPGRDCEVWGYRQNTTGYTKLKGRFTGNVLPLSCYN